MISKNETIKIVKNYINRGMILALCDCVGGYERFKNSGYFRLNLNNGSTFLMSVPREQGYLNLTDGMSYITLSYIRCDRKTYSRYIWESELLEQIEYVYS